MRRFNLRLAIRQLRKDRGFTLLHILGLTLGLTAAFLITLYVVDELNFDRFNTNAARIYRVDTDLKLDARVSHMADAAPPVAPTLLQHYPQVEAAVRMLPQPGTRFLHGEEKLAEPRVVVCDPSILDIFTLPMIEGDRNALHKPRTVVITESTARRYFSDTHVVGRTISDIDDSVLLTVTGVIRDLPARSSFHYDFFISMTGNSMQTNASFYALFPMSTFILLRRGADAASLQRQLAGFMNAWDKEYREYDTTNYSLNLTLTKLTDIHLRSNRTDELEPNSNIQYVYIFSAIAVFVLIIAAINFMNLATARSAARAREVGVRKVLGSPRSQLIAHFLTESFILTLASTLLAIGLTAAALPFFNQLSGHSLAFDGPTLFWLLPSSLVIVAIVGLLAGAYPAFFLSAFRPVDVLKNQPSSGIKGGALRSVLVVFQFSISLFLIIGTGMIYRQLHYIQTRDLGFDRSRMLTIKNTSILANPVTLKQEVMKLPGVEDATLSGFLPTNDRRWHNFGSVKGSTAMGIQIQSWLVDADYIPTFQMQMVKGRNFSPAFGTDSTAVVLNETAARTYGIAAEPIGKILILAAYKNSQPLHVIGVVKDFNFASLRSNVSPLCMIINQIEVPDQLNVRIDTRDIPGLLSAMRAKWNGLAPHQSFEFSFLDSDFDAMYRSEERIGNLSVLFSILAIIIASLGLFGLAAHAAERRSKEINIRKVFGASAANILALLSTSFLRLILASTFIATPLAWLALRSWLDNFAYRTTISPWLFALSAGLVLLIALATTIFQSIRVAFRNPADTLRNE